MNRAWSLARIVVASAAGLTLAACGGDSMTSMNTGMERTPGRLIARDSLTAVDANQLPCCSVDSSGARVVTVAGALTFYALAQYTDSVATPGGVMSRACVQEVPNGAYVHLNGLVTLPGGGSYLDIPCSVGTYSVTLTEQMDYGNGSSVMRQVSLSSGTFDWKRDALTMVDQRAVGRFAASMSGDTITVMAPGHRFVFKAVSPY